MNGGGGSSFNKLMLGSSKGPIKTILMGDMIVATLAFQAIGESIPSKESGGLGKPLGPVDPKSVVVIKRKANPQTRKIMTNFFLEISIKTKVTPNAPAGQYADNASIGEVMIISDPDVNWLRSTPRAYLNSHSFQNGFSICSLAVGLDRGADKAKN